MTKQLIDVEFDDENSKIIIILDEESYGKLEKQADNAGMSVKDFAKKIIMGGMEKEMRNGD